MQPFPVRAFNEHAARPERRLPDFGRPASLGLLVGNTRALWPRFRAALAADAELAANDDPLDTYTVRCVEAVLPGLGVPAAVRYAHVLVPEPLPIQRVAQAAGLAWLSPSRLSIHPEHGPWIALRAVIVVDVAGPDAPAPPFDPCTSCAKPCLAAFDRALLQTPETASGPADWRAWLAVRDACPLGQASRYDREQTEYHYSKLRALLGRPGS